MTSRLSYNLTCAFQIENVHGLAILENNLYITNQRNESLVTMDRFDNSTKPRSVLTPNLTHHSQPYTWCTGRDSPKVGQPYTWCTGRDSPKVGQPYTWCTGRDSPKVGQPYTWCTGRDSPKVGSSVASNRDSLKVGLFLLFIKKRQPRGCCAGCLCLLLLHFIKQNYELL